MFDHRTSTVTFTHSAMRCDEHKREKETQKRSSRVTQRRKKFFSHFSRRMSEKVLEKKKNERKCENANKSNSWVQVGIIVVYRAIWKYRTVTDYVAKKKGPIRRIVMLHSSFFFCPCSSFHWVSCKIKAKVCQPGDPNTWYSRASESSSALEVVALTKWLHSSSLKICKVCRYNKRWKLESLLRSAWRSVPEITGPRYLFNSW